MGRQHDEPLRPDEAGEGLELRQRLVLRDTEPDWTWEQFVEKAAARGGRGAAITIPMLGWVAKEQEGCAFTSKEFPKQEKFNPHRKQCGNGKKPDSKTNLDPPKDQQVAGRVDAGGRRRLGVEIKAADAKRGKKVVFEYILDNEPALWDSSHRDVHPEGSTSTSSSRRQSRMPRPSGARTRTRYIAGPAEWGWPGYFFSGKDAKAGFQIKPERPRAWRCPVPRVVSEEARRIQKKKNGVKLLDVLDVHIYPQAEEGVRNGDDEGGDGGGDADRATTNLRLRTTRSLWDRDYMDRARSRTRST